MLTIFTLHACAKYMQRATNLPGKSFMGGFVILEKFPCWQAQSISDMKALNPVILKIYHLDFP